MSRTSSVIRLNKRGSDVVNLLFKVFDEVIHREGGGGGWGGGFSSEENVAKSFLGLEADAWNLEW